MKRIFLLLSFAATLATDRLLGQTNTFPSSGNVGIGTTAPSYPLHLSSSLGMRARLQFGTSLIDFPAYGAGSEDFSNSSGIFVSGSDGLFMTAIGMNMRFVTNNGSYLERMRITSTGDMGIGIKEPLRKLHVYGGSWPARVQNSYGYIDFGPANEGGAHIYTDMAKFFFNKDIELVGNPSRISAYQNNPFRISVGGGDKVFILPNGNLGVGITNPSQKLEVNGTIRAKEIKLETVNWPDFVFEKGYGLMPLQEVKAHIDQKGHLPGLKSAREYQEQGVNMLELNQKLLEKVEELTLHAIAQEGKLDGLEAELEILRQLLKERP